MKKTFIRYVSCFIISLLASWIVSIIVYQIVEYINPSNRYNANGEPEFVMPIRAVLLSSIAFLITLISVAIWTNKIFKNKFIKK